MLRYRHCSRAQVRSYDNARYQRRAMYKAHFTGETCEVGGACGACNKQRWPERWLETQVSAVITPRWYAGRARKR